MAMPLGAVSAHQTVLWLRDIRPISRARPPPPHHHLLRRDSAHKFSEGSKGDGLLKYRHLTVLKNFWGSGGGGGGVGGVGAPGGCGGFPGEHEKGGRGQAPPNSWVQVA